MNTENKLILVVLANTIFFCFCKGTSYLFCLLHFVNNPMLQDSFFQFLVLTAHNPTKNIEVQFAVFRLCRNLQNPFSNIGGLGRIGLKNDISIPNSDIFSRSKIKKLLSPVASPRFISKKSPNVTPEVFSVFLFSFSVKYEDFGNPPYSAQGSLRLQLILSAYPLLLEDKLTFSK